MEPEFFLTTRKHQADDPPHPTHTQGVLSLIKLISVCFGVKQTPIMCAGLVAHNETRTICKHSDSLEPIALGM